MSSRWHGIRGGLAVAFDEPDWGGYALDPVEAMALCRRSGQRGSVRVWVQRRWRRLLQCPPAVAVANDASTRVVALKGRAWVDEPLSARRAAPGRTPPGPFTDPGPIFEALAEVPGRNVTAQVLQEVRDIWLTDGERIVGETRGHTFLHVDGGGPCGCGVKRSVALRDDAGLPKALRRLVAEVVFGARAQREARVKVNECGPTLCLAPTSGQVLHEIVGHAFESLAPGRATPWHMVGRRATEAPITVCDDPCVPCGFASRTLDDAGNPARATVLIDRGIVADGFSNGGCWIRGAPHAPLRVRATNLVVSGESPRTDMVREAWSGVLVSQLGRAHFDPRDGMFSIVVTEARRIRDGRAAEPVRPFRIRASAATALRRLVAAGGASADEQFFCVTRHGPTPSSVRQPSLLFEGLVSAACDDA